MSGNGKVAFSLGGKKKKKGTSEQARATAAAFAQDNKSSGFAASSQDDGRPKDALVIPMSQPTQSLLTRIKQEGNGDAVKEEEEESNAPDPSSSAPVKTEPDGPVISSGENTNGMRSFAPALSADSSKEQFQRDLHALPDEADEETYEAVPVSQFGAALLRGMGWSEKGDTSNDKSKDQSMPRPYRLGLGAIPKAPSSDENMPSVLTGRRKKARKQTVQQLEQQAEYEKKRKQELERDKQRTKQIGSIVYLTSDSNRRVKLVQLMGVPGLNMVLVQFEGHAETTPIKKGEIGPLVGRPELEKRPFKAPKIEKKDDRNGREKDRKRDKDRRRDRSESPRRKRDEDRDSRRDRSRSRSPERDRHRSRRDRSRSRSPDDRRRDRRRDRSRSPDDRRRDRKSERSRSPDDRRRDRKRDRSRSEDRFSDERRSDRKRDRSLRDRDRKRDRKSKDRDRDRDRDRKRRRSDDRYDEDSDGGRQKDRRREDKPPRKSSKQDSSNPLWIIPNIRVRVVSEKLGKRYFKEKGVVVDVTRQNGATLRMDMTEGNGNSVLLEHVPERYLETALPKKGGNAIVLMGSNKWTKGRLLERDSRTGKGAIEVFEDLSILNLPLDDLAEWCGPLDDDLG